MKKGISLIVLVITIIVMIILAASVVVTLSNTGIINRANDAVAATDLKQIEQLASIAWSEAVIAKRQDNSVNIEQSVLEELENNGISPNDYGITVTDKGVTVTEKPTIGSLVKGALDYGKTVNYEANGVTDWRVFYETDEYVYLIASEPLAYSKVPTLPGMGRVVSYDVVVNGVTKTLGAVRWSEGWGPLIPISSTDSVLLSEPETQYTKWMGTWGDYSTDDNEESAGVFLDETLWSTFKNTTAGYKDYVVGAIGTPTAEMFIASWNQMREVTGNTTKYDKKLGLTRNGTIGYLPADITTDANAAGTIDPKRISTADDLYVWSTVEHTSIWLAKPHGESDEYVFMMTFEGDLTRCWRYTGEYGLYECGVRPVICLKNNAPAKIGTTKNFELIG